MRKSQERIESFETSLRAGFGKDAELGDHKMPTKSRVTTTVTGRTAVIRVEGNVDQTTPSVSDVVEEMLRKRTRIAILDLTHSPLINSDGLDWLEDIRLRLEPQGVQLRLVAGQGSKVQRILGLMKYERVLASLKEAFRFGKRKTMRRK